MPEAREVCAAAALRLHGAAVCIPVAVDGAPAGAFFVRAPAGVVAYVNRCAHQPIELDWNPGQFFDAQGYLVCAMHGALYDANDGQCVAGPCVGARLLALRVEERETPAGPVVYWLPDARIRPVSETPVPEEKR